MIRLRTLGALDLSAADGRVLRSVLAQPKRLALLIYLAAASPRGFHRRDVLLALFWPESDQAQARHALRQALHFLRRELGAGVVLNRGDEEIGLADSAVTCDAVDFEILLGVQRAEEASELYRGDFLQSFFVSDVSPEFEQWIDTERQRLRLAAATAASALAQAAETSGRSAEAVHWARRASALVPDDEGVARRLLTLLDRCGNRAGALRAYQAFAERLAEELESEPSAETKEVMARIAAHGNGKVRIENPVPSPNDPIERVESSTGRDVRVASRRRRRSAIAGAIALGGMFVGAAVMDTRRSSRAAPVIAVGEISVTGNDSGSIGQTVQEVLATNLGRVEGLHVVSRARLIELLSQLPGGKETAKEVATAARLAGATSLIEGVLFRRNANGLQLDLRRVDLRSGIVAAAYSVEATDPFVLADRATARISEGFALLPPMGSIAGVTSTSLSALRYYEDGLRRYYRGDTRGAAERFLAALAEDTTFAMAAYYASKSEATVNSAAGHAHLRLASRLSARATERERLLIRTEEARRTWHPSARALAESLATRYPTEPDGHLMLGEVLSWLGEWAEATRHLRIAVDMDSASLLGRSSKCRACDAFEWLIGVHLDTDSLVGAEGAAREWLRRRPESGRALVLRARVLQRMGRDDEAQATLRDALPTFITDPPLWQVRAELAIGAARFDEAERILAERIETGSTDEKIDAVWWQLINFRYQGRMREALALAHELRALEQRADGVAGQAEAQLKFETGRYAEAAAQFDSIGMSRFKRDAVRWPEFATLGRGWNLTLVATALSAAGDTARLTHLADSIEVMGRIPIREDRRRLHHFVRGLLSEHRGARAAAIESFRKAIFSYTFGYGRINLELGRALLESGRPAEAVGVLGPALRGNHESAGFYTTHTELRELLARAYEAAGQSDSALVQYRRVAEAWSRGDPEFRARAHRARVRIASLDGGQRLRVAAMQ